MKYLISIMIAMSLIGCATSASTKQLETKPYTGDRSKEYLLGVRLGCSERRVEWGYTEKFCGTLWGQPLEIDWGN